MHVLTMVNNVIGVVNYVIAARPSLGNFVIADSRWRDGVARRVGGCCTGVSGHRVVPSGGDQGVEAAARGLGEPGCARPTGFAGVADKTGWGHEGRLL